MSTQPRGRGVRCEGADRGWRVLRRDGDRRPRGRHHRGWRSWLTMKPRWTIRSAPVTTCESSARSGFETND